jgi:hypothetical protein
VACAAARILRLDGVAVNAAHQPQAGPLPLPQGTTGIAALYPDDAGISSNPAGILVDDFESYGSASQLWNRCDTVFQMPLIWIAFWVDGVLIADCPSVRLRDVDTLDLDKVSLSFHINGSTPRQNLKWYDNVVIARSHIGPTVTVSVVPLVRR